MYNVQHFWVLLLLNTQTGQGILSLLKCKLAHGIRILCEARKIPKYSALLLYIWYCSVW